MSENIQRNQVLNYLKNHHEITSQIAWDAFGITRLSSIIHRLRKAGVNVITIMEDGVTRSGSPCRYARYVLRAEK